MELVNTSRKQLNRARSLRKNSTKTEEIVWFWLRARKMLGLKFRRQHRLGSYIADFYCAEKSIAIEVDGKTHDNDSVFENDELRSNYLKKFGIKVIRIDNVDVLKRPDNVYQYLEEVLKH